MKFLKDILNIFYPDVCLCCKNPLTVQEETICLTCRFDLPLTNFSSEKENLVEKTFYGRVLIESGTALFYFLKPSSVQQLIHELKYRGQQQVGEFAGNWLGEEILLSERFENLDCIIPVPLHKNKLKARGYNQLTVFGETLSKKLNIPFYEDVLFKTDTSKTQTKKLRLDRWKNTQHKFIIQNNEKISHNHILLIDDIITTGATLEACASTLLYEHNIKVSIASIAYTK